MEIEFIPYTNKLKEAWEHIARNSQEAYFTHLADWIDIEESWDGVKSLSFLIKMDGQFVGIFPLFLVKKRFLTRLMSIHKGWGGPAFINTLSSEEWGKLTAYTYQHIDKLAIENKVDTFELVCSPTLDKYLDKYLLPPFLGYGFEPGVFTANLGKLTVINLQNKTIDDLYKGLDKKCRYEIRKHEKLGLKLRITRAESEEDIRDYYMIHFENYTRTGAPPNPYWYFQKIYLTFAPLGIANFFFVEEYKPESGRWQKVAAINVGLFNDYAVYWTGASLNETHGKGINNYIQWEAIKWLKEKNVKYYEIGELDDSTDKAISLGSFKKSFGGEEHTLYRGMKIYRKFRYKRYLFLRRLRKWYSNLGESLLDFSIKFRT